MEQDLIKTLKPILLVFQLNCLPKLFKEQEETYGLMFPIWQVMTTFKNLLNTSKQMFPAIVSFMLSTQMKFGTPSLPKENMLLTKLLN